MISPQLLASVKRGEGCRLTAYPDPLSGGEPWTIGWGHASPQVRPGMVWSQEEADETLLHDIAQAQAQCDAHWPWWRQLSQPRQDALCEMCFNLGPTRLAGFRHFLAALDAGNYDAAADEMLASAWSHQVGDRAKRLATQMRSGAYA